jgi:arginine/lysine/ornithine decarboxylase
LYAQNAVVAVFGLGERAIPEAHRLVCALRAAADEAGVDPAGREHSFAPPPPWGELVMTPREAYLGPQEVVAAEAAVGRIAAESLATYPPGIPNVLPGERLGTDTLRYIQRTLADGGSIRGASDRQLRTIRVVMDAT